MRHLAEGAISDGEAALLTESDIFVVRPKTARVAAAGRADTSRNPTAPYQPATQHARARAGALRKRSHALRARSALLGYTSRFLRERWSRRRCRRSHDV
jgi:hypothetical protein